jgi:hypothetical protein
MLQTKQPTVPRLYDNRHRATYNRPPGAQRTTRLRKEALGEGLVVFAAELVVPVLLEDSVHDMADPLPHLRARRAMCSEVSCMLCAWLCYASCISGCMPCQADGTCQLPRGGTRTARYGTQQRSRPHPNE